MKIVTDAPGAEQEGHVQSAKSMMPMLMRKLRCVMRFPGPNDVVKLAERGYEAAERVISLVPRIVVMVAEVEQILVAARTVIAQIETVQAMAADVVLRTDAVVSRAENVCPARRGLRADTWSRQTE